MKLSWGYKIMLVYLFFVAGVVFLAVKSSMQKFELVQPDYYADELKYQSVIDATVRAKNIGGEIVLQQESGRLIVRLPAVFATSKVNGKAHLYFAADIQKDIVKEFQTRNGAFVIETVSTSKGNYTQSLILR